MSTRFEWVDLDHPFFGVDVVEAGESVAECEATADWACAVCGEETDDPEIVTSDCESADLVHDWHGIHPDECGCDPELIVPEGKVALVLSYDEVVVLVGEPARVRSFLLHAHNQLPAAPEYVPTGVQEGQRRPGR